MYFASLYGRGDSLQLKVDCPKYSSEIADDVKYIDASAVLNKEKNEVSFFIVNRSENDNCNIDFDLKDFNVDSIIDQQVINNEDMYAANTKDNPYVIKPKETSIVKLKDNKLSTDIPSLSYLVIRLKLN